MHQDISLIATITMGIFTAFVGGYIAKRLGLPSLVGYLLAGLAIGPFTPGFVGDSHAASQLAEIGVIFMMFGVGLHFSLEDLWTVRKIAIPGAIIQMTLATIFGLGLSQLWGWSISAGLVLGLALSIASTVVLLRGLSDSGLLNTVHGKVAVGWLILEDLATVAILVLLPALVSESGNAIEGIAWALLKTGLFIAIMLIAGARFMPWLLARIAYSRSRELFILAIVALALGTALAAYQLFSVSLALGAFLAGMVVGKSDVSNQVGAEIVPLQDIFTVLFFVSVGMLVNPSFVLANIGQVIALTVLIVLGKGLITLFLGMLLPAPGRTLIVVAAGLSQIGEFSFIVGQTGVALNLLSQDQYGLILASALLSIILNPLMFNAIPHVERLLQRLPRLWRQMETGGPLPLVQGKDLSAHVVIVGYGRVGKHIGRVLKQLGLRYLVIELDAAYAVEIQKEGIQTLFGDAANSEILTHSGLEQAQALVVTVPSQTSAELIVASAHKIAPKLMIIARAGTETGVQRLAELGATHVIHPELEGGLEIVRHTLLALSYPMTQIQPYIDAVRHDAYGESLTEVKAYPVLDQLLMAVRGVDISWYTVEAGSPIIGKSLVEASIRLKSGASVIAIIRNREVIPNPRPEMLFEEGDLLGLMGSLDELEAAVNLLNPQAT